jgi:dTDP-4-amino-4,6-dideoxygalactose transaminase
MGLVGCFSFFPTKNLGGCGDGGMVITSNKKIADKIMMLRKHGAKKKYHFEAIGLNSRLDTMQAAILNIKLKYLNNWNNERIRLAKKYTKELEEIKEICLPLYAKECKHVFHQYTIRAKKRDQLRDFLSKNSIPTMLYYPGALHEQKAFKNLGYKKNDFPEAVKACKEVLSLPIYPGLSKKDQDYIIKKIKEFYNYV